MNRCHSIELVEHHTSNAEVMGSNPVEALNFFQASFTKFCLMSLTVSEFCFIRRSFVDGQGSVSGRRSSISSMTSFDFRVGDSCSPHLAGRD